MPFRKCALSLAFAAASLGTAVPAIAQDAELSNPGVVIEIYVEGDNVEIVCPTTQCNAKCRDVEGMQILLQSTFYRVGSGCSLTITDGALLQEAIETVLVLVGEELPGGPDADQGLATVESELQNTESNPNQNNPEPASPLTGSL